MIRKSAVNSVIWLVDSVLRFNINSMDLLYVNGFTPLYLQLYCTLNNT